MPSLDVVPEAITAELLLTATTAVSHHDPAVQDDSNRSIFNRQKQFWHGAPLAAALPTQEQIDALCRAHEVPWGVVDLLSDLSLSEFVGTALAHLFMRIYNPRNGGEGEGIFQGLERYSRLEARLRQAAARSHSLRGWWNRLVNDMCVGIHETRYDEPLLSLLSVPRGLQHLTLRALVQDYRSIVALARAWAQAEREDADGERVAMTWDAGGLDAGGEHAEELQVPAVSGNSIRHQVVRWPAWLHLCNRLELNPDWPGQGPVPAGVEAIFVNGGNIESGARQTGSPFLLAQAIRRAYPSLDLLGGVTDTFDLGESRLRVAAWLVCRENRSALAGSDAAGLPMAGVSAFDMLDERVETRQEHAGEGQMIRGFEVLASGVQVLVRLSLSEYTPALTRGALLAAVSTYLEGLSAVGGQAARGYGWMAGEWLRALPDRGEREAYEEYLAGHWDLLRQGLADGTLTTGKVVLT